MQKCYLLSLFQESGEGRIKESGGRGESKYDNLIHDKNLCKCHNVPPVSTTIK
jgi:hypothetical protein